MRDRMTGVSGRGRMVRLVAGAAAYVALLGAAPGCGGGGGGPVDPMPAGGRVLFVGNSLTYFNDLPEMVRGLTEAAGLPAVEVESVAFPDYDLGLHLDRGDAMRAIRSKRWTLVVLQQGPSSLEENRAQLRAWTVTFAADIRKAGARPALYMVWPSLENAWTFDRAEESYRLAADDVDGVLFPVGEAFRVARTKDAAAPLYQGDGYHPTTVGSYLAALVILARMHDRSPVGLPRHFTVSGHAVDIPESLAALLQEAAAEANARFPNP